MAFVVMTGQLFASEMLQNVILQHKPRVGCVISADEAADK